VTTWLDGFYYVERDVVQDSPIEVIPTALPTNLNRLKTSHIPSSSNTKPRIGHQFSRLLQEDNKIAYGIFNGPMNIEKCTKKTYGVWFHRQSTSPWYQSAGRRLGSSTDIHDIGGI
jgi:hypothetical protein